MRWRNVGIVALVIIGPGVVAALIEYVLTRGSSGWIPVLASATGGILVLAVRLIMQNRHQEATEENQENVQPAAAVVYQPRQQSEPKILSPRTPEELVAEIEGRTEIVAKEISKRHIGTWLRVEGTITSMSDYMYVDDRRIIVGLDRGDDLVPIYLNFSGSKWRNRLMSFDNGDAISAEGQIEDVSTSGFVSLENCELLE